MTKYLSDKRDEWIEDQDNLFDDSLHCCAETSAAKRGFNAATELILGEVIPVLEYFIGPTRDVKDWKVKELLDKLKGAAE